MSQYFKRLWKGQKVWRAHSWISNLYQEQNKVRKHCYGLTKKGEARESVQMLTCIGVICLFFEVQPSA